MTGERSRGAIAAAVGLAFLWAVSRVEPSLTFPPFSLAERTIRAAPGDVATFFIERLEDAAMPALAVSMVVAFVAIGTLLPSATRLAGRRQGPKAESAQPFALFGHLFPIRGKHNLGFTATNNFGGGGKRKHMGQDMFARCGTQLAAARGGKVQFAGYHSRAGNYVVIDGAGTETDYVYMHMRRPPLVSTGQQVFTGQKLGEVGDTGRASGCHLHFELWTAPGWYEGGRPSDPLPSLTTWDRYS